MKTPSKKKIDELRLKLAAYRAAQIALCRISDAHVAMTDAGITGGCAPLYAGAHSAVGACRVAFDAAYDAESGKLCLDGKAYLHIAVWRTRLEASE